MSEEKRIYVIIPAQVQVPNSTYVHNGTVYLHLAKGLRWVQQPAGRQVAQACHVVSKLRLRHFASSEKPRIGFKPVTTVILQARDSKEMGHVLALANKKRLEWETFSDENREAYGDFKPITALALMASPKQVKGILDYLPLWGSQ